MLEASIGKFTYDSANRLTIAGTRYYTYDVEGTRIKTQKGEDTTKFVYNVNARLSQLLIKTENNAVTKYVYGLGLIGEETSGNFKTYHFDYRGSTVAITDKSGNVTDTFEYDTYGRLKDRTGTTKTPFLYNGRDGVITEDDTGLIYMRARYYSTALRRFVNADKLHGDISNALSLNRYSFCNGDPANGVDPLGLSMERNGIIWYDSADKAAYAFAVEYNRESMKSDTEIGTSIYSQVFYWYNGNYYSSIEMGKAYDGTGSLTDFYKKFKRVRLYYYDHDVAYGISYQKDGQTYKGVEISPKRKMGSLEAMVHTHGNVTSGGENEFSVARIDQNGKVIYNDTGMAYMYKTYGFNAFNSKNPNESHGIEQFVLYLVTPDGELKKLIPRSIGEYEPNNTVDNPFDDNREIPIYNK